jgi:outer membrane receptor for ferric coprogen and ferric-rhodotorulic acid
MNFKTTLLASGAFLALASPGRRADDVNRRRPRSTRRASMNWSSPGPTRSTSASTRPPAWALTLRETPQSVTVITAQRILDQNLQTVADIVTNTVGVSGNQVDDVRNTFNARGFEIKNYQIDGVPTAWTLAGGAGETMADVSIYERVEIVRGATGLMTGAGDPSASINLVRKHATATEFQGYVSGGLGSWNNRQIQADVAGPLTASGKIRGRAVAKYEKGDNFIDWYKNEKSVLYGVIDADLNENTLLRVGASQQKGAPNAPAWGALPTFFSDGSVAIWPRSKTASANWSYWDTTNQNVFANLQHRFANGWSLSVNYNWARNAQTTELLYMSGLIDKATGGAWQFAPYPYRDDGESIQNSVDVQLKGDYDLFGRQHEFVAGALHSKQHLTTDTFAADFSTVAPAGSFYDWTAIPHPTFATTGSPTVDQTIKQTGYYVATRLNVTDAFKVVAGARLASWSQKGFNYGAFDFGDDNVLVPYLGALYDLTPNHRLYASYTEIFQPQNARDYTGAYLDPITGESSESA